MKTIKEFKELFWSKTLDYCYKILWQLIKENLINFKEFKILSEFIQEIALYDKEFPDKRPIIIT